MIRSIIYPGIMCRVERVELTMLDYRSDPFLTEFLAEFIPIEAFVSHDSVYVPEVSRQDCFEIYVSCGRFFEQ